MIPNGWTEERHAEATERVAKWDAGDIIWTLEMGGMGPGYEQAIQGLCVEMVRDALTLPIPNPDSAENETWGDAAALRTRENGYSGAQVGAARWLAWQLCVKGWEDVKRRAKEQAEKEGGGDDDERTIMVSNMWPKFATTQ